MRRRWLVAAGLWVGVAGISQAQVSIGIGIGLPGVNIGINLPVYPTLVPVPGYPVYYAPQADTNYFFYDGMYWVYQDDGWYASSWYNGPWSPVDAEAVPLFILRIPVRYYRRPPPYFGGWRADAPPHWGERWGNGWEQQHRGWDRWDRNAVPRPAPLPSYQRQYSGSRYPNQDQQRSLLNQNYRYQPQEPVIQQHYQGQRGGAPGGAPGAGPGNRRAEPVIRGGGAEQRSQAAPMPAPAPERANPVRQNRPPPSTDPHEQQFRQMQPQPPREPAGRQPAPSSDPHEQQSRQMQTAPPPRGEERGRDRGEQRDGGR